MSYYDTIRNPSTFSEAASAEHADNFDSLFRFRGRCPTAVSLWGRKQLFASRVICTEPRPCLPLFVDHYPNDPAVEPCISRLIMGYGPHSNLTSMQEPQIVRQYEPDSLGYVWAALAPFLRAATAGSSASASTSDRTQRLRRPPPENAEYVASDSFQIGSSSPTRPDSANASESSIGFAQALSAPLLEDSTIRLASCFIRCVLNYGQPLNKASPFIQFRDERQKYRYETTQAQRSVEAIDDGGIQLFNGREMVQVAMIEGKRTFQVVIEGKPVVSDEVLAQLVGEALALKRHEITGNVSEDNFVTILAVTHFIKFFHFHISDNFIEEYEILPTHTTELHTDTTSSYMRADSTVWFDIMIPSHRKHIVSHLLALVAWADYEQQQADVDMED